MSDPPVARPSTALRVADLDRSLAFYRELPGMTLVDHAPERDLARLNAAGYPVLLAGPRAPGDLSCLLAPGGDVVAPGGTLHVLGVDLDALGEWLTSAGVAFVRVERPWGDRAVRLTDPDGYRISFETPARWSPEEAIRHYEAGPRLLEEAVAGLDAAGLDTHREPNGWTIRQVAHHLADVEALTYPALLAALAEPGREWLGNPWPPDGWAAFLDYRHRAIEPSLALFDATRASVLALVECRPGRWHQSTRSATGSANPTVIALIGMLAGHALEHVEEIRAIRAAAGNVHPAH